MWGRGRFDYTSKQKDLGTQGMRAGEVIVEVAQGESSPKGALDREMGGIHGVALKISDASDRPCDEKSRDVSRSGEDLDFYGGVSDRIRVIVIDDEVLEVDPRRL